MIFINGAAVDENAKYDDCADLEFSVGSTIT